MDRDISSRLSIQRSRSQSLEQFYPPPRFFRLPGNDSLRRPLLNIPERGRRPEQGNKNDSWFPLVFPSSMDSLNPPRSHDREKKQKLLLVCHRFVAKTAGDPFKSSVAQLVARWSLERLFFLAEWRETAQLFFFFLLRWSKMAFVTVLTDTKD